MIQISELAQVAKFVYMDYPSIAIAIISIKNKGIMISSGLATANYTIGTIQPHCVIPYFGEKMGGDILKLCSSLSAGNRLSADLLKSLDIKDEKICLENSDCME